MSHVWLEPPTRHLGYGSWLVQADGSWRSASCRDLGISEHRRLKPPLPEWGAGGCSFKDQLTGEWMCDPDISDADSLPGFLLGGFHVY